jgi:hypothetical protein
MCNTHKVLKKTPLQGSVLLKHDELLLQRLQQLGCWMEQLGW